MLGKLQRAVFWHKDCSYKRRKEVKMKKTVAVWMTCLFVMSAVLLFPTAAQSSDPVKCFQDHSRCRENALSMDAPWWKAALYMTICDIALAKCILAP